MHTFKAFHLYYLLGYLLLLAVSVSYSGPKKDQPTRLGIKHVIVIGIDGLSPDGIIHAETPVLDSMMKHGAFTLHARGVLPTSSSPNWASMVSGAGPEQHGITSNDWQRDARPYPPVVTGSEDIFPTIFGVVHQQRPELEIGAIYHWSGFGRLIEKSTLNFDKNPKTEYATLATAAQYIKDKKPNFLFVHFDHVDHAGHEFGHGTKAYYHAVTTADSLVGNLLQASKEAGTFEETTFIISSDHGGVGHGHGGQSLDELEIPFIIYGKDIKKGKSIKESVYTYDNAATVAFMLDVKPPYAWVGKPIKSVFETYSEPEARRQN